MKASWCKMCKRQMDEYKLNPPSRAVIIYDIDEEKNFKDMCKAFKAYDVPTTVIVDNTYDVRDKDTWEKSLLETNVGLIKTKELERLIRKHKGK